MGGAASKKNQELSVSSDDLAALETNSPKPLPGPSADLRSKIVALHVPSHDATEYLRARDGRYAKTWNYDAMGYPSAIAECETPEQVALCVQFAAKHCAPAGIALGVACGRHSTQCLVRDSFVIDVSRMNGVTVDAAAGTADVLAGSTQGQLDDACEPHGVAVTAGHVRSTGCGGLIPQGGHGMLERIFGLTVDNLIEADIVLADGTMVTARKTGEHAGLFWAICGAGTNFGVLTRFRLRVHKIPTQILGGQRFHVPLGRGWLVDRPELITKFCTEISTDRRKSGILILPLGGPVIEVLAYIGDVEEGKAAFAEHRRTAGYPLRDAVKPTSYWKDIQRIAPDARGYFYQTGVIVKDGTDPAMGAALASVVVKADNPVAKGCECVALLVPSGGAVSDVPTNATAYPLRHGAMWILVQAQWKDSTDPEARASCVAWVKKVKAALAEFQVGEYGVLSEVAVHDGTKVLSGRNVFGSNLPRLQELKNQYDPSNLFSINDNIATS
eukprot:TRINITY_DN4624_c1_g1_i1.p1 TRINITY_DN4624_c1_g1~~TRINITY_DN4624_c1_g1_i1.p1  ORF type:complete len:500 (+),score=156.59 TRINITY_DN4624_c1_g1_i1:502-2001(+)